MAIALFDLGRTLVRGDPAILFARTLRARGRFPDAAWHALERAVELYHGGTDPERAVERANAAFAGAFIGLAPAALGAWAEEWLDERGDADLYPYTRPLLRAVAERGYRTAAVTGVADPLASAIGRALGLDETYATALAADDEGRLTGAVAFENRANWKRTRVAGLLRAEIDRLDAALAFGDSEADLCLLRAVGRPVALNAGGALRAEAEARGWPQFGQEDDVALALPELFARPPWNVPTPGL